jgi:hypothetical protein
VTHPPAAPRRIHGQEPLQPLPFLVSQVMATQSTSTVPICTTRPRRSTGHALVAGPGVPATNAGLSHAGRGAATARLRWCWRPARSGAGEEVGQDRGEGLGLDDVGLAFQGPVAGARQRLGESPLGVLQP